MRQGSYRSQRLLLSAGAAIVKTPVLLRLARKDFVVAVGVEGWIDGDEVDRVGREFFELFKTVAAATDSGVVQ